MVCPCTTYAAGSSHGRQRLVDRTNLVLARALDLPREYDDLTTLGLHLGFSPATATSVRRLRAYAERVPAGGAASIGARGSRAWLGSTGCGVAPLDN